MIAFNFYIHNQLCDPFGIFHCGFYFIITSNVTRDRDTSSFNARSPKPVLYVFRALSLSFFNFYFISFSIGWRRRWRWRWWANTQAHSTMNGLGYVLCVVFMCQMKWYRYAYVEVPVSKMNVSIDVIRSCVFNEASASSLFICYCIWFVPFHCIYSICWNFVYFCFFFFFFFALSTSEFEFSKILWRTTTI